jgi:hypothetical protein
MSSHVSQSINNESLLEDQYDDDMLKFDSFIETRQMYQTDLNKIKVDIRHLNNLERSIELIGPESYNHYVKSSISKKLSDGRT